MKFSVYAAATIVVLGAAVFIVPKVIPDAKLVLVEGKAAALKAASAPLRVAAYTVARAPFVEIISSTGSLRAEESVELQAEINGKVVAINFTEGAHVQEGALLVKLNDADLRATKERALQRRQLATLRERRLAQLVKDGVARQEEYDISLSELQVQNAEIALADAQIAKTEIRAPFAGVVGLRYVSAGAFVTAATRVATLQRLERLKIDFSIPEKYATRIKIGSPITFSITGADRKFVGQIYAFDPRIDSSTRSILLRAIVPNIEDRLLPGTFANVEFSISQVDDAILVPAVAVIPGLTEKNVFVVQDGKALRRAVETGTRTASQVHILTGLRPGDVVITSGLQQMREGLPVTADTAPELSPTPPQRNAREAGATSSVLIAGKVAG